ncbi:MAG: hypothetical protein KDI62_04795, partial [Anaerolineae bacterium]|nr:hypothetical protein [Anaerolineae bacterium]
MQLAVIARPQVHRQVGDVVGGGLVQHQAGVEIDELQLLGQHRRRDVDRARLERDQALPRILDDLEDQAIELGCAAPVAGVAAQHDPAAAVPALEHERAAADLEAVLSGGHNPHFGTPVAVSLSQITEMGTAYRPDAIAAISGLAREHGLGVHMDGARFAGA